MEIGKLTAKLRDAVPVCFLVEGKEIKRYKNIEIPDELKKLEYQDFKFDVPLNGAITFKMFELGVLHEEFPQTRERRTRKPLAQGTEQQVTAAARWKTRSPATTEESFSGTGSNCSPSHGQGAGDHGGAGEHRYPGAIRQ